MTGPSCMAWTPRVAGPSCVAAPSRVTRHRVPAVNHAPVVGVLPHAQAHPRSPVAAGRGPRASGAATVQARRRLGKHVRARGLAGHPAHPGIVAAPSPGMNTLATKPAVGATVARVVSEAVAPRAGRETVERKGAARRGAPTAGGRAWQVVARGRAHERRGRPHARGRPHERVADPIRVRRPGPPASRRVRGAAEAADRYCFARTAPNWPRMAAVAPHTIRPSTM